MDIAQPDPPLQDFAVQIVIMVRFRIAPVELPDLAAQTAARREVELGIRLSLFGGFAIPFHRPR